MRVSFCMVSRVETVAFACDVRNLIIALRSANDINLCSVILGIRTEQAVCTSFGAHRPIEIRVSIGK